MTFMTVPQGTMRGTLLASRLQALDAVRGAAVLLVVGYHTAYRFVPTPDDAIGRFISAIGWIGVDLFFALSGYLVVHILLDERARANIGSFARKRVARIVPLFALSIALFAVSSFVTGRTETLELLPLTALFLNGYLIPILGEDGMPFTIAWSLSVEVTAYILLGVAASRSLVTLRRVLVGMVVAAIGVRAAMFAAGYPFVSIYVFPPARLDAVAFGGLAAWGAFSWIETRWRAACWLGLAVALLIAAYRWLMPVSWFLPLIGFALFGLAAAIWVGALARGGGRSGSDSSTALPDVLDHTIVRPLARVGLYSYFIYLFHLFVIEALLLVDGRLEAIDLSFWTAFGLASLGTFALGAVSWRWFERPAIDAERRRAGPVVRLVP